METLNKLNDIKMWLLSGAITYEQAKKDSAVLIDALNKKSAEIAFKYGQNPKKISFASFMR